MKTEKIKTIIIIAFFIILLCGIISYVSFNMGKSSKLKEMATNGEFAANVPVLLNNEVFLNNETNVTEVKTFRLQDYFVTIIDYNKLQTDCQNYINQIQGK